MIITQPERVLLQAQIKKYAHFIKGDLLDVGSGRSRRYSKLFTNVTSYKTIDTDARGEPDILGSAEDMPVPNESFDSVLCTQVLEHVRHPHVVMSEIFRVLRPGGYCLLTVPQTNELHEVPHDYFRYTPHGLRVLFEDVGFVIKEMDQRGTYHALLAQLRVRHLIETFRPYERKWAMILLAPLTKILTTYGLWRDRVSKNPAARLHAIGWCVLAQKPTDQ